MDWRFLCAAAGQPDLTYQYSTNFPSAVGFAVTEYLGAQQGARLRGLLSGPILTPPELMTLLAASDLKWHELAVPLLNYVVNLEAPPAQKRALFSPLLAVLGQFLSRGRQLDTKEREIRWAVQTALFGEDAEQRVSGPSEVLREIYGSVSPHAALLSDIGDLLRMNSPLLEQPLRFWRKPPASDAGAVELIESLRFAGAKNMGNLPELLALSKFSSLRLPDGRTPTDAAAAASWIMEWTLKYRPELAPIARAALLYGSSLRLDKVAGRRVEAAESPERSIRGQLRVEFDEPGLSVAERVRRLEEVRARQRPETLTLLGTVLHQTLRPEFWIESGSSRSLLLLLRAMGPDGAYALKSLVAAVRASDLSGEQKRERILDLLAYGLGYEMRPADYTVSAPGSTYEAGLEFEPGPLCRGIFGVNATLDDVVAALMPRILAAPGDDLWPREQRRRAGVGLVKLLALRGSNPDTGVEQLHRLAQESNAPSAALAAQEALDQLARDRSPRGALAESLKSAPVRGPTGPRQITGRSFESMYRNCLGTGLGAVK